MAKKSVTPELDTRAVAEAVSEAIDTSIRAHPDGAEYFKQAWEDNPLAMGITNRLRRVDYCIKAIAAIHTVMHEDETKASLAADDDDTYVYQRIPAYVRENLRLGLTELTAVAEQCIEDIREDTHGIATSQAKGGR